MEESRHYLVCHDRSYRYRGQVIGCNPTDLLDLGTGYGFTIENDTISVDDDWSSFQGRLCHKRTYEFTGSDTSGEFFSYLSNKGLPWSLTWLQPSSRHYVFGPGGLPLLAHNEDALATDDHSSGFPDTAGIAGHFSEPFAGAIIGDTAISDSSKVNSSRQSFLPAPVTNASSIKASVFTK